MGDSSKKVTVGYKYYLGQHIVLCHGPVDRLIRIRVDQRNAWFGSSEGGSISINSPNLFGGEKREGGISGTVDFANGGPAQGRNSYLQGRLGAAIPAFRGVAALVLRQVYLGLNPYLKNWDVRVQRIFTRQSGLVQWYSEKAEVFKTNQIANVDNEYFTNPSVFTQEGVIDPSLFILPGSSILNNTNQIEPGYSSSLRRNFATEVVITRVEFDLQIHIAGQGDPLSFRIVDRTGAVWFTFISRRQDIVDPLQRASFTNIGGSGQANPIGETALPIGVVFAVTFDFDIETNIATISIRNKATNELLAEASRQINSFSVATSFTFGRDDDIGVKSQDEYSNMRFFGFILFGDMNPAHIVRECLTDPDWGLGYKDSDIDDASFTSAANALFNEGMGISIFWDRQSTIYDFIDDIIRHIDAALFIDRISGKFKIKLIRNDYIEADLLILDESNIDQVTDYSRPSFGELINSVTVNFWLSGTGKASTVTVHDSALIQMQGAEISTTVEYGGFTNEFNAHRAASRDLRTLSTPLLSCTLYVNRSASALDIGDTFKFEWPDLHSGQIIMRVTEIALGDGRSNKIRLKCVQDAFSTPILDELEEDEGWVDPSQPPTATDIHFAVEAPYYELVRSQGQGKTDSILATNQDAGFLSVGLGRPDGAINASLFVDSGAGYEEYGIVDFSPYCIISSDITHVDTVFPFSDSYDLDEVVIGTYAQINQELVRIDAIAVDSVTVGRGVLDTVPMSHVSGSLLIFSSEFVASNEVEYVAGESVSVKQTPTSGSGSVLIEQVSADTVLFSSRAIRPYPPGNIQINNLYYPTNIQASNSTTISWAHRDRLQQTAGAIEDTLAGDIGPEAGTTYTVEIRNAGNDALIDSAGAIAGTSAIFDTLSVTADALKFLLWSVRGGLDSWQAHEWVCDFINASSIWTPAEIDTALWLDADDSSTITIVSSAVSQWNDKSVNSRNASQATAGERPTILSANLNSKDVLDFDGIDDTLVSADSLDIFRNIGGASMFAVCKWNAPPGLTNRVVAGGVTPSGGTRFILGGGSSTADTVYTGARTSDDDAGTILPSVETYGTDWIIQNGIADYSSGNISLYVYGTLQNTAALPSSGNSSDTNALEGFSVGSFALGNNCFPGRIAEVIVLQSIPSTDTRQKIEGYLAHKWGLTANLHVDHPYKNSPPINAAPWTPSELTLENWFDAADADTIILDGSAVSQWQDKSGNAAHANRVSTVGTITVLPDEVNGNSVIRLPGNRAGLTFQVASLKTIIFVWRWRTPTATYEHPFTASGAFHGHNSSNLGGLVFGNLGSLTGYNAARRANGVDAGAGSTMTRSASVTMEQLTFASNSSDLYAIGYDDASFPARSPSIDICEFIASSVEFSLDDRQKIEGYLAHKWGLTANLHVDHPYKNSPPTV